MPFNLKNNNLISNLSNAVWEKTGILPYIVEKDFWVVTLLDWIFNKSKFKNYFIFKGGTTLSKAFKIIDRFSEDIDLSFNYKKFFKLTKDVPNPKNPNQIKKIVKFIGSKLKEFVIKYFLPELTTYLKDITGKVPNITWESSRGIIKINYFYPKSKTGMSTIDQVLLEISCFDNFAYFSKMQINSLIGENFPDLFKQKYVNVILKPWVSTLCDKISILHNKSHSDIANLRYSRHWFDVYKIIQDKSRLDFALNNLDILFNAFKYKQTFFYTAQAKYDEINNANVLIIPNDKLNNFLKKDYLQMSEMIFGIKPKWEEIIIKLTEFQKLLNLAIKKYIN